MNPYWIKADAFRLAIIPRPRGQDWLLDDIRFLQRAGVDVVVSALTASENEELGLVDERQCCQSSGVEFLSFAIEDRSVPSSFSEFEGLIRRVAEYLRSGKAVSIRFDRRGCGRIRCHSYELNPCSSLGCRSQNRCAYDPHESQRIPQSLTSLAPTVCAPVERKVSPWLKFTAARSDLCGQVHAKVTIACLLVRSRPALAWKYSPS